MTFREELPGILPFPAVATCLCISPVALSLPFMFLTIFSSIRHQPGATRIFAGCLRSSGHASSSPASKKDRWHFATVLYPFLGNYIISHSMYYILRDIKATHSTWRELSFYCRCLLCIWRDFSCIMESETWIEEITEIYICQQRRLLCTHMKKF